MVFRPSSLVQKKEELLGPLDRSQTKRKEGVTHANGQSGKKRGKATSKLPWKGGERGT